MAFILYGSSPRDPVMADDWRIFAFTKQRTVKRCITLLTKYKAFHVHFRVDFYGTILLETASYVY